MITTEIIVQTIVECPKYLLVIASIIYILSIIYMLRRVVLNKKKNTGTTNFAIKEAASTYNNATIKKRSSSSYFNILVIVMVSNIILFLSPVILSFLSSIINGGDIASADNGVWLWFYFFIGRFCAVVFVINVILLIIEALRGMFK